MKRNGILFAASIVVLVVSTFLVVTHQHDNTADDHDCPTCYASHHQIAGLTVHSITINPFFRVSKEAVAAPLLLHEHIILPLTHDRAPPARLLT